MRFRMCVSRCALWTACVLAASLAWLPTAAWGQSCYCPPRYGCRRPASQPAPQPTPLPDTATAGQPDGELPPDSQPSAQTPPVAQRQQWQYVSFASPSWAMRPSDNGFIDPAFVATHFRFRFDAAYDNPFPDRAEFFQAKCGCLATLPPGSPELDPTAPGPPLAERRVDFQEASAYLEVAEGNGFSGFVELPVRAVNPEVNENSSGLADMEAGFKAALANCRGNLITFQFKTYIPTGNSRRGRGTDNFSIEPALLMQRRLSERGTLFGEARYWTAVGGTDFAGDIFRYGLGYSHDIWQDHCRTRRFSVVTEVIGWSVLDGRKFDGNLYLDSIASGVSLGNAIDAATQDASGDTIINTTVGGRFTAGHHSLYAGWGHSVSDDMWYEDIARVEYRRMF